MSVQQVCAWLETTMVALFVRESIWGFALVVAIHILGLSVSVGTLVWFDLRLLGVSMRGYPVSVLYRRLMPWTFAGFTIMFSSGAILFAAYATAAYGSLYFRIKVAAIVLAGLNALFFHLVTERHIADWNDGVRPPPPARFAGLVSIVVWAVVILAGRMMSYTIF
jgi:hypothetical protein